MSDAVIRSYVPSDLDDIQKIHEASGINYKLPDLNQFPVLKALEVSGEIKAAYGMRHTVECYMWLDKSGWADAEQKWLAIKSLDKEATEDAKSVGIDNIFCCVPPGFERFGRRISDKKSGLGFSPIRDGWKIFTKHSTREE